MVPIWSYHDNGIVMSTLTFRILTFLYDSMENVKTSIAILQIIPKFWTNYSQFAQQWFLRRHIQIINSHFR